MNRVRRRAPRPNADHKTDSGTSLPLRWAVIIMAAIGAGLPIGAVAGPVAGVTVAIGIAGFLHKVLA